VLFFVNIRYAFAGIVLAVVVASTLTPLCTAAGRSAVLALCVSLVFVSYAFHGALTPWPLHYRRTALVIVALAVAAFFGWRLVRDRAPSYATPVAMLLMIALLAVGYRVEQRYFDLRYHALGLSWLTPVHDANIGVAGVNLQYQFYGPDLSNRVQYIGQAGPHGEFSAIGDCGTWRRAVTAAHYQYVVHYFDTGPVAAAAPPSAWTGDDQSAHLIAQSDEPKSRVYRIDGPLDPTCW
jgi:hypothetical protein